MAIQSVATNPESYGAAPIKGNFTTDAGMHLWCAHALSCALSTVDEPISSFNDDIRAALRYLLKCEVERAMNADSARHETTVAERA